MIDWTLPMVEKITSCVFITKVFPSSWCSYLSTGVCHDSQHIFPHLNEPCTWHNCNKRPTPRHIRWDAGQSHRACRMDSTAFGHSTQLGELRFPRCHAPTGSDLCINSHWNVVILLACFCFQIFCQNLVIIVWGTWYVCHTYRWILGWLITWKRYHDHRDENLARTTNVLRQQPSDVVSFMRVVMPYIYTSSKVPWMDVPF